MNIDNPHWLAVNHIVGLAFDRLPNGRLVASEVRKDEAGTLRVPIGEMTTADFYALASRLKLEILPSKFASAHEMQSFAQAQRRISERNETARTLRDEREAEKWK